MQASEYVYHWTHRKNLRGILERGLDPEKATGAQEAVWACDGCRVAWALAHVADRHSWNPDDLILLRVQTGVMTWVNSGYRYIFRCRSLIPPDMIDGVLFSLLGQWVDPPKVCRG